MGKRKPLVANTVQRLDSMAKGPYLGVSNNNLTVSNILPNLPTTLATTAAFKSPNVTLSNGNLTATATTGDASDQAVFGSRGRSTGKWYFEVTYITRQSRETTGIGLANYNVSLNNFVGQTANSFAFYENNGSGNGRGYTNGAQVATCGVSLTSLPVTVGVAVDLDAKQIWFNPDNQGFIRGATNDGTVPTSNSSFDITALGSGLRYPMVSLEWADQVITNFGGSAFAFTVPTGFAAWYNATTDIGSHTSNMIHGTIGKNSGKWYFEATITGTSDLEEISPIGLATADARLDTYNGGTGVVSNGVASGVSTIGYVPVYPLNGQTQIRYGQGGRFSAGDISPDIGDTIGIAYDLDNKRAWFRLNNNQFMINGNNINIFNPSDFIDISFFGTALVYPSASLSNGDTVTMNFGTSAFVGDVPAGFVGTIAQKYSVFDKPPPRIFIPNPSKIAEVIIDNQVIDGLTIRATGTQDGITCSGFSNVIIRNCLIFHEEGCGINFSNSPNITIQNCNIIKTNSPAAGANLSSGSLSINGYNSTNPTIGGATSNLGNRVENGSSGVYLLQCSTPHVLWFEGHNIRGPFPRGQLVQFDKSDGGEIRHFSVVNDLTISWTEDNINIFQSNNTSISDGVIDGNNSPSGDGIMIEGSTNSTIDLVDVINWGNGAFASAGSTTAVFTNCRADFWHTDGGRGPASSNGLTFAAFNTSSGISYDSTNIYGTHSSANILFDVSEMTNHNPTGPQAFTARSPLNLFPSNSLLTESGNRLLLETAGLLLV